MNNESTPRKPLRLWPGIIAAALIVAIGYVTPIFVPDQAVLLLLAPVAGGALILLWWLFFSRARWYERIGAVVIIAAATFAQQYVVHPSIAGGAMGLLSYVVSAPMFCLALVGWAWATRTFPPARRAAAVLAAIVLGSLPWNLVRTGGMNGDGKADLHWRWSPTPEERLLAQADEAKPLPAPAAPATPTPAPAVPSGGDEIAPAPAARAPIVKTKPAEWPGFRGPDRDDVIHGVQIATNWTAAPPVEMWRRAVGPGWSSFAVSGDLVYTQEQRGAEEVVSCYRKSTGAPVWRHRDATRFWESNGGAGPRGTPTLSNGRVYTLGATGILNVLDAVTGAVIWSRNVAPDVHVKVPMWGISSSPLVIDDLVVVAAGPRLAAYDIETGTPRWTGGGSGFSYSSPHLATIDGVQQILFMSGPGTVAVAPATGKVLWEHKWEGGAIVQPALTADGGVLVNTISTNGGVGIRRVDVAHHGGKWTAEERWTSAGLKPYFNDFVVHKGYAYGFDGSILSCINLQDGQRKWKGGRYGAGQLLLLADQDLLVVVSEEGELALVDAAPDGFTEVARFPALEGKTWNHPVIVRDVLLVRNDHEMAAFKLSIAARDKVDAPSTIAGVSKAPNRRNNPSPEPRPER